MHIIEFGKTIKNATYLIIRIYQIWIIFQNIPVFLGNQV